MTPLEYFSRRARRRYARAVLAACMAHGIGS